MKYEFKVELRKTNSRKRKTDQGSKTGIKIGRLKKNLILAHQIARYMETNNIYTLGEMSRMANISVARLSQILRVLQLSLEEQEALLLLNFR